MNLQAQSGHALPEGLMNAFAEGVVMNAEGAIKPLHSNVSLEEAGILYGIVKDLRPEASAEIGLAQGISAMAILKALEDNKRGIHHVMDPFQARFDEIGLAMIRRAGLEERLRFHRKFAEEVVPSLPPLQFAFVDASHLFDLTLAEFVLLDKKLEPGGVIALHDAWMPSLQKCTRYILANRAYELVRDYDPAGPKRSFSVRSLIASATRGMARLLPSQRASFSRRIPAAMVIVSRRELDHTWKARR